MGCGIDPLRGWVSFQPKGIDLIRHGLLKKDTVLNTGKAECELQQNLARQKAEIMLINNLGLLPGCNELLFTSSLW